MNSEEDCPYSYLESILFQIYTKNLLDLDSHCTTLLFLSFLLKGFILMAERKCTYWMLKLGTDLTVLVSELTQNVWNLAATYYIPRELLQAGSWKERRVCNHQVIWNINNLDVVNVSAQTIRTRFLSRICMDWTKEDRGWWQTLYYIIFVSLETNESVGSQTITTLPIPTLKCLSYGSFLPRWFIMWEN